MTEESHEHRMRKLAAEMNYLQSQASELQRQLGLLQNLSNEVNSALLALEHLSEIKKETLFPLGSGVFVKIKLVEENKVLADIGGRVVVEKEVSEVKKLLENRLKQLSETTARTEHFLADVLSRINTVEEQVVSIQEEKKM